jgi:RNA polymerase sigma-70 factor
MQSPLDRPDASPSERIFTEGSAAWTGVVVDVPTIENEYRRDEMPAFPADVYLAIACDLGTAGAWEALEREFAPRLRGLLRKRGATEGEAAEMLGDLPGYLCEPPPDGRARTRIGTYDGSGALFSWLAVIALRTVNQRRQSPAAARKEDGSVSGVPTLRAMPPGGAIAEETARRFQAALAGAWAALTPRERLAVLLRYRDGLSGREIARLMGVGEPRVSRLIEAGLTRLQEGIRRQMPETPPGTSSPDSAVWVALGGIVGRHLANIEQEAHNQDEATRV